MTNISKHKLPKEAQDKLFKQFTSLFTQSTQKNIAWLFESLFTDAEKIMFIKRLAVILMVSEGYSTYAISKALLVSDGTARTLKKKYLEGEYNSLIKTTQHKDFDSKKFWASVEVMLRLGMPSRGKDRWKSLDKYIPK